MGKPGRPQKRKLQPEEDNISSSSDLDSEFENPVLLGPVQSKRAKAVILDSELVGPPVPAEVARRRWPLRYQSKHRAVPKEYARSKSDETEILQAKCHYEKAIVDECSFKLGDTIYVKAEDGMPNYIARIVELFETVDNQPYFRARWFYRAEDTVISKDVAKLLDSKRVFSSDVEDDNPLNCIFSKVAIAQVAPDMDLVAKEKIIKSSDLYYDMKYSLPYLTFQNLNTESSRRDSDSSSITLGDSNSNGTTSGAQDCNISEKCLLDLYSGCGAMSTGLCMGASLSRVKLVTKWAVDINEYACKSLRWNHPETKVRNEAAEDFLSLLKEWEKLCEKYVDCNSDDDEDNEEEVSTVENQEVMDDDQGSTDSSEEFEVERLLKISYGDPNKVKKTGLYFKNKDPTLVKYEEKEWLKYVKTHGTTRLVFWFQDGVKTCDGPLNVRWKGYDPSFDTWEPIEGLSNCKGKVKDFVREGYKSKLLPLPGNVDFICGGPPCQGISGFNRYRNVNAPLNDVKNRQLNVFMDIVEHLKPKHVLMENVVDILKFADGFLGRYAIARLVSMNYQSRVGMMAAGSYGVPQFRMRVFFWGAHHSERLPQYPLPTHEVAGKGVVPNEFKEINVACEKENPSKLQRALTLGDAISDLPVVGNCESQDQRQYGTVARTMFQKYIRVKRSDMITYMAGSQNVSLPRVLYDHQPLKLNDDDYERVLQIPKKKGANFRDLPGVVVGPDNKVEWDKSMDRVMLKSGKPLVPDYAMKFVKGRSTKPFGRLWMDEIVGTVVTRAEPHNQALLHPSQDRVLTIRENARLQGFPDCYRLFGPIEERYVQVGNAVAIPVAIALGYAYGQACRGLSDDSPLTTLPFKFPSCLVQSSSSQIDDSD